MRGNRTQKVCAELQLFVIVCAARRPMRRCILWAAKSHLRSPTANTNRTHTKFDRLIPRLTLHLILWATPTSPPWASASTGSTSSCCNRRAATGRGESLSGAVCQPVTVCVPRASAEVPAATRNQQLPKQAACSSFHVSTQTLTGTSSADTPIHTHNHTHTQLQARPVSYSHPHRAGQRPAQVLRVSAAAALQLAGPADTASRRRPVFRVFVDHRSVQPAAPCSRGSRRPCLLHAQA